MLKESERNVAAKKWCPNKEMPHKFFKLKS